MTPDQADALIQSQSQLMASERETMLAEDGLRLLPTPLKTPPKIKPEKTKKNINN